MLGNTHGKVLTQNEEDILYHLGDKKFTGVSKPELLDLLSGKTGMPHCVVEASVDHLTKMGYFTLSDSWVDDEAPNAVIMVEIEGHIFGPLFDHAEAYLKKIEFLSAGYSFLSVRVDQDLPLAESIEVEFESLTPKWDYFEEVGWFRKKFRSIAVPLIRITNIAFHYDETVVCVPIDFVVDVARNAKDKVDCKVRIMRVYE